MLQRDTFFGRRNEKPEEPQQNSADARGFDTPAAHIRNALAASTLASADNARKTAKEPAACHPPKSDDPPGSRLIVGPNIKLKGVEITDCDTLIVEGHVEATIDSRMIQIAPGGTFSGIAGIDVAEINGGFSGELTVRKCLTVHATGKVSGKIRYGKLMIAEGGEIGGDVRKLSDDEKSIRVQHLTVSNRPATTPVPVTHN